MTTLVFSLGAVYLITGFVLVCFAFMTFADREHPQRWGTGSFWLTLGIIFGAGDVLPHWVTGLLVLVMVGLDGAGQVRATARQTLVRERDAGDRIFIPVLTIPMVTFAFAVAYRWLGLDANRGALVGLGYGSVLAMIVAVRLTRSDVRTLMSEGRRINELMGSVTILPQLLASLGVIFTAARLGDFIAGGIVHILPAGNLFLFVVANCVSMAMLTMLLGNSFAAFPVIAAGVLVPLVITPFGADPSMVAILTLSAGASGTLMTPMAANFNIVPVALLGMKSDYAVIRVQIPMALALLALHILLMWSLIRFG